MCIERWRRGVELEGNEKLMAVRVEACNVFDIDRLEQLC